MRSAYQEFKASLPKRKGYVIVMCPKCMKVLRTLETDITKLNDYAFTMGDKRDTRIEMNGIGCCF